MEPTVTHATSLKPLSAERHRHYYWRRVRGYHHAAERVTMPVTLRELSQAVGAFPLAFLYRGDRPILHAILGAESERSAFVDASGRWRAPYIPAFLRGHPFYLAQQGSDRYVVAVDESAAALSEDPQKGEALFDDQGKPTQALQRLIDFFGQLARNRVLTDRAAQALAQAGVLDEWPLTLDLGNTQPRRLAGLYQVNEARLNALDPGDLQRLRDTGALALAYAQVMSRAQRRRLETLAQMSLRERYLPEAEAIFGEPDLEAQIDWERLDGGGEDEQR